jgi:hypothetical protein
LPSFIFIFSSGARNHYSKNVADSTSTKAIILITEIKDSEIARETKHSRSCKTDRYGLRVGVDLLN